MRFAAVGAPLGLRQDLAGSQALLFQKGTDRAFGRLPPVAPNSAAVDEALQRAKLTEKAQKPGHLLARLYDLASACLGRAWSAFSVYSRLSPRLFS